MKAYTITWNNHERYQNHIILRETFHLECAFMKMDGSGFSDILLEARLIGSGSLKGVLSGKHYERTLHYHKVLIEALEQLLFRQYQESESVEFVQEGQKNLNHIVETCSFDAIESALNNDVVREYLSNYLIYHEKVKTGIPW